MPPQEQRHPPPCPAGTRSNNTTWTRNLRDIDGSLAGAQTDSGAVSWNLTDLQRNTVATINNTTGAAPAAGTTYSEYGAPRTLAAAPTYGWLGTHQRCATTLGGLILMGIRLYNPQTGRFLTTDPRGSYREDPARCGQAGRHAGVLARQPSFSGTVGPEPVSCPAGTDRDRRPAPRTTTG